MDVLSETSFGGKVVAARHVINEELAVTEASAVNKTFVCHSMDYQPDFFTYRAALQIYGSILWTCAGLAVLSTCLVFVLSLRTAFRRRRKTFTNATFVLAVYPVVAVAGFITILVPRARMISEALAQQAVMVGMYHLYHVLVKECGGPDQLVRCAEGARLETRVLPCCCWPCCIIPRPELHTSKLTSLRYLVLQLPIVQAILYVIILTLWSEDVQLYINSFIYVQVFVVISILMGVWGMIMCVRAAESAGARPRAKFLVLQIALLIVKLQCGLVKVLPEIVSLPCWLPLHPVVFINLVHNSAMIVQMFLLSIWAWHLYSTPDEKSPDKVQHAVVTVLEDTSRSDDMCFSPAINPADIK